MSLPEHGRGHPVGPPNSRNSYVNLRKTFAALAAGGVLLGVLTAPVAAEADALKYYVDCSAKTSGNGLSASTPWNSVSSVTTHGAFYPGEQILLKRGTTCTGRIVPSGSGTKTAPIVLGAYGSGAKPTVQGKGTANLTGVVQLTNQAYFTVQDLHVTNTDGKRSTTKYRAGVLVQNSWGGRIPGITLQRLTVDHVNSNMSSKARNPREWGGIAVITNGVGKDGFDGMRVVSNTVSSVGRTGLIVANNRYPKSSDTGLVVSKNRISHTRGDGVVVAGSKGAVIDGNTIAHAAEEWPCPECGKISPLTANAGLWTIKSTKVVVQHNEVYGTKMLGGDGEGIDVDLASADTVVQYNYVHDNQGGGILFCGSVDAVARFNIFENNEKSAFAFIGSIPTKSRTSIYNNTVYNSSKSRARVVRYFNGAHSAAISFKNNLLYNYGTATYLWPTKKVSTAANTLIGHHGAGRPRDRATSWVNPGLKKPGSGGTGIATLNGYKPKHPSSFKKGVSIPTSVQRDFFGKKINPRKPPRGAAG